MNSKIDQAVKELCKAVNTTPKDLSKHFFSRRKDPAILQIMIDSRKKQISEQCFEHWQNFINLMS